MNITHAVIVTGSRRLQESEPALGLISRRLATYPESTVVIHGAQVGADMLAHQVAMVQGKFLVPIPYFDWLGRNGGPERNRVMLHTLLAYQRIAHCHIGIEAFPAKTSRGTWNMIDLARNAWVPYTATDADAFAGGRDGAR